MNKNYFFLLFVLIGYVSQAQIFSAGFEDNNGTPLSEFKIVNNDSLEVPFYGEVPEFNEHGWIQFYDGPDNKIAFSTSYYDPAGQSDDWLITPAIEIPNSGQPTLYWKAKSYDFENLEDYEIRVSTTDNELESFDDLLETITGEQPFDFNSRQLDLSAYKGQTIYLAFVNVTFNGYFLAIDDLYISESEDCILPSLENIEVTNLSENGFAISWENPDNIGSFDVGLTTFDVPVSSLGTQTETSKTFSDLEPGTRYQLFLKNDDCGSGWASPKSIWTAIVPEYSYDFEYTDENFGEYDSDGWSSSTWLNSFDENRAQSGEGYIFNNTSSNFDKDDWIYSPPIKLEEDEKLMVTFYAQLANALIDPAELEVVVSSAPEKAGHLEIISSETLQGSDEGYEEYTAVFVPEEAGVFYVGFGNVTPMVELVGPLRLDNISFETESLSVDEVISSTLKIYPNPVKDLLHIESADEIQNLKVFALDGKVLEVNIIDGNKLDFSKLSNGVYFVEITTPSGTEVKKVIK